MMTNAKKMQFDDKTEEGKNCRVAAALGVVVGPLRSIAFEKKNCG